MLKACQDKESYPIPNVYQISTTKSEKFDEIMLVIQVITYGPEPVSITRMKLE